MTAFCDCKNGADVVYNTTNGEKREQKKPLAKERV